MFSVCITEQWACSPCWPLPGVVLQLQSPQFVPADVFVFAGQAEECPCLPLAEGRRLMVGRALKDRNSKGFTCFLPGSCVGGRVQSRQ